MVLRKVCLLCAGWNLDKKASTLKLLLLKFNIKLKIGYRWSVMPCSGYCYFNSEAGSSKM